MSPEPTSVEQSGPAQPEAPRVRARCLKPVHGLGGHINVGEIAGFPVDVATDLALRGVVEILGPVKPAAPSVPFRSAEIPVDKMQRTDVKK